jgi:hypothetical protein
MVGVIVNGGFKFENCLLKHYVRTKGWLPLCKERARELHERRGGSDRPRLKYFTFCAAGAVDVIMLDLERVVRRSSDDQFDTVYFFDIDDAFVAKTRETIPGAIGFPADFVAVVLAQDPEEPSLVDTVETLEPPDDEEFTRGVREKQRILAIRREFVQSFPFDIVNLDLERYLFRPREKLPGKLVNAFRKVFEWQRRAGITNRGRPFTIDGFSLMFTLRIGPRDLGDDYKTMMESYVTQNILADPELPALFALRSGGRSPSEYLLSDFDGFFKLAAPKTVLALLKEEDWHVNDALKIFEFERQTTEDPYTILHFVMDVKRNNPPQEERAPGCIPQSAAAAYTNCIKTLFSADTVRVEPIVATIEQEVSEHLDRVFRHRAAVSK